jgi:tetratricopeptide (TPR) repeat protein
LRQKKPEHDPMRSDQRGIPLTTESDAAAAAYDETVTHYLEFRLAATPSLKKLLEADPDFAMGHCLKGFLLSGFHSVALQGKIAESLAAAEALSQHVTWREKASIAALAALHRGDSIGACRIWDEILVEHPRDLLSARLHHHYSFWLGRNYGMRDGAGRLLSSWDENVPGYGFLLGMHAFGLEESGDYAAAEASARRAVELNSDDLWAVHALGHVFEMQGRLDEGLALLTVSPDAWADRNPMKEHLYWHLAMFALESGDHERVLMLYDDAIFPEPNDFYLNIQNAVSILLRLELRGVDVGNRWDMLANICSGRIGDHFQSFTDTHVMIALARRGFDIDIARFTTSLFEFSAAAHGSVAAENARSLTLPLSEAIAAYFKGNHQRCIERLLPIRLDYARIGASHAQRDIFSQILIDATVKAGALKLARNLLSERLALRPRSSDSWAKFAEVLNRLEEPLAAGNTRQRAAESFH